jgi:hypothetical protein
MVIVSFCFFLPWQLDPDKLEIAVNIAGMISPLFKKAKQLETLMHE